ncbi:MAG: RagB/SusD family nutrient uptake outer membrane protein [Saprospiraceae bacterium]|nr:RagB/SusD family nutrient uptake outer membrane protein [Saprospiraceae bacterium]MCF8248502.1 RagB/SusD family nutrient uptake outer membrane protein [Saprospiraceae bacterium]MCF8280573.1 RagB/SusD family nutrient uptake outer membrane protein [Bacteroidales bacterium]MCF8310236.1 RagB/SusD family nutrient uptake outer membrane protein [Saprospiraceae bacterium]MCF8439325.1 RagB/SusD family nutrient uptake outer membrane protein [Saprospiraceae bacterium]
MKFYSFSKIFWLTGILVIFSSCFKDLDTVPTDKDELTSAAVYENPANYKKVLARLYAGLSVTGQQGPAGQPDISGIDEGFGGYIRMLWCLQELSTDEAVIGWNDATIKDLHEQDWSADDGFNYACYSRIFYQVAICNEFLRETTDAKLDSRNVDANLRSEIKTYRAEARFLRALSYYHALDLYRTVPFVTEEDQVGSFFPEQISAVDLYNWLETEIKAFDVDLAAPRSNEYGRADQAAAWMLLAKLYLNANVYVGKDAYADAATYSKKVIDAGYELETNYPNLFLADNHKSKEIIFPVTFDGVHTRSYAGMTFLVHAPVGGSMAPSDFGIDGGWGGLRTTSAIVNKYPAPGSGGSIIVAPNQGNTGYPVLNVPGSYQGWDPELATTVVSSPNSDDKYEGYFWFEADTKFKFALGGWATNWGDVGADGTLELNGDDIAVAEAGFYKINVDLAALTYTLLKTDWGLIGSATADGWDSDQNMTYDAAENAWTITADLVAGEIKFRANDDWPINYGDDGANAILEAGGANIAIPANGTYLIKLYLDSPDHTYYIEKFASESDNRYQFYSNGQTLEIADISQFTEGYAVAKYKNVTSTGAVGSDLTFVDTDFPMFRLADAYLMYAEALLRSGGSQGDALAAVNTVRTRAYGGQTGAINSDDLTLDFLLDERARELLWEGHRRTDLVRFGKFTNDSYLWPWKGGVAEGVSVDDCRNVYPIPSQDLNANNKLKQNSDCY